MHICENVADKDLVVINVMMRKIGSDFQKYISHHTNIWLLDKVFGVLKYDGRFN